MTKQRRFVRCPSTKSFRFSFLHWTPLALKQCWRGFSWRWPRLRWRRHFLIVSIALLWAMLGTRVVWADTPTPTPNGTPQPPQGCGGWVMPNTPVPPEWEAQCYMCMYPTPTPTAGGGGVVGITPLPTVGVGTTPIPTIGTPPPPTTPMPTPTPTQMLNDGYVYVPVNMVFYLDAGATGSSCTHWCEDVQHDTWTPPAIGGTITAAIIRIGSDAFGTFGVDEAPNTLPPLFHDSGLIEDGDPVPVTIAKTVGGAYDAGGYPADRWSSGLYPREASGSPLDVGFICKRYEGYCHGTVTLVGVIIHNPVATPTPMPTSTPTPTPNGTPTAPPVCNTIPAYTPPQGFVYCPDGGQLPDCLSISWQAGECVTVIPQLNIPLSKWGLSDVGFPGFEICPIDVYLPRIGILGFVIDPAMFVALFIGVFVARLLWAQMGG